MPTQTGKLTGQEKLSYEIILSYKSKIGGPLIKRFKRLIAEVTQLNLPRVSNHGEPSEATRASQTDAGGLRDAFIYYPPTFGGIFHERWTKRFLFISG